MSRPVALLGDLGGRKGALLAEKSARFGNAERVGAKTRVLKYTIAPLTRSVAGPTTAIRNATLRTASSDRNTDRLRHRREGASRPNGGSDAHRPSKLAGLLRHRQRDRNSS